MAKEYKLNINSPILFVTGIDTDAGKSIATGWLAKTIADSGRRVITQKMVQTGNVGSSEDIEVHRQMMGCGELPEDAEGLTAPQIFAYPASAHLAARLENKEVDIQSIDSAMEELAKRYDTVLVEGAGGLMVPLREGFTTADWLEERKLPTVVVTNGRLGSINHTLLTFEALKARQIPVKYVVYNTHYDTDPVISPETLRYISKEAKRLFPEAEVLVLPEIK